MRYLVDTSVLVYFIMQDFIELKDNEKEIVHVFAHCTLTDLVVPDFVITELAVLMQKVVPGMYNFKNTSLHAKVEANTGTLLQSLEDNFIITSASDNERRHAIDYFTAYQENYPFQTETTLIDILCIAISKSRQLELLSLDEKLLNLSKVF